MAHSGSTGSLHWPIGLHHQALRPQDILHTLVFLSKRSLLPARPLYVMILKYIRNPGLSPDSPPHWTSLHLPEVMHKPFLPPPRPHTLPTRSPHLSPTCLPSSGSPGPGQTQRLSTSTQTPPSTHHNQGRCLKAQARPYLSLGPHPYGMRSKGRVWLSKFCLACILPGFPVQKVMSAK